MGGRIAGRLLAAGHEVVVWNRSAERVGPLVSRGATAVASPAEAAHGVEAVLTMVADPAALRDVTEGAEGVLAAGARTVIQSSTVGPADVARLAAALPAGGGAGPPP